MQTADPLFAVKVLRNRAGTRLGCAVLLPPGVPTLHIKLTNVLQFLIHKRERIVLSREDTVHRSLADTKPARVRQPSTVDGSGLARPWTRHVTKIKKKRSTGLN